MPPAASSTPRTRGHKKKERTRRQLIAAAVDVIAERGEAFSVSDVIGHAGVANGTFYNYFTDRDALIDAVVPEVLMAFADEGALAVAHEDPAVRFATISAFAFARAAAAPDAVKVILRLDAVQQAIRDGVVVSHLRKDLDAGVVAGRFAFADADAALDVIIGSLLMAARRIVAGHTDEDYRRSVLEQILRSLGLDRTEALSIAADAVNAATELQTEI